MGIPSYFSTIRRKYTQSDKKWMRKDLPTHTPCKHLYVDMNGIVHTCAQRIVNMYETYVIDTYSTLSHTQLQQLVSAHSEKIVRTVLQPSIFVSIREELQHLLDTVQPTDLLYLALDGVAPRAKMEQQRQRRHRSVCDTRLERSVYNKHKKAHLRGLLWDSNCVTPGTSFMCDLAHYIHSQLSTLCAPTDCVIQFSDTTEHGEGEHKIMEHMRACVSGHSDSELTDADSAERSAFVLYGQDADLIMLGLVFISQHTRPFYLLREPMQTAKTNHKTNRTDSHPTVPDACRKKYAFENTIGLYKWTYAQKENTLPPHLHYLDVNVLQTHIISHIESYGDLFTKEEQSNVTSDYVVLCFLLGNDFLPHFPSLCIQDKGIDVLLETYVPLRKRFGVFLTSNYYVDDADDAYAVAAGDVAHTLRDAGSGSRVETHIHQGLLSAIIEKIAQQEDYLAGRLHTNTLQKRKWMLQKQRYPKEIRDAAVDVVHEPQSQMVTTTTTNLPKVAHTLERELQHLNTLQPCMWALDDAILPGTPGWKRRYYTEVERVSNMNDVHTMCKKYMEGLFWISQYYFHGCYSTTWYYPYLSAPLFANMEFTIQQPRFNINRLLQQHTRWEYTAISQLLTIMPKESLVKYVYRENQSATLDEHPISYKLVPFSKRFRWECPVRLPFVDDETIHRVAARLTLLETKTVSK